MSKKITDDLTGQKYSQLEWLIMMIAQADTGDALDQLGSRGEILRNCAKDFTKENGYFPYWE